MALIVSALGIGGSYKFSHVFCYLNGVPKAAALLRARITGCLAQITEASMPPRQLWPAIAGVLFGLLYHVKSMRAPSVPWLPRLTHK